MEKYVHQGLGGRISKFAGHVFDMFGATGWGYFLAIDLPQKGWCLA